MRRTTVILGAMVLFGVCSAGLAEDPKAVSDGMTVSAIRLAVGRGLPGVAAGTGLRMLSYTSKGTEVTLLLADKQRRIIAVDQEASRITTFSDDKGSDLAGDAGRRGILAMMMALELSDDGHFGALLLHSDDSPAAGSTQVIVKGTLVVVCGADEKTAQQKDVALVAGAAIKAGPVAMEITEVEEIEEDKTTEFTVRAPLSGNAVAGMRFLDGSGAAIDATSVRSIRAAMGTKGWRYTTWAVPAGTKRVTVEVTYYEKTQKVDVPLDLSVGLGL